MRHRWRCLTLTYRLLLVGVLIITTVWPLAGPPTSLGAAPPDAPPTPTPPVSPTPSSEPGISPQGILPPSPEDVRVEVEQARARQAMEAALAKYLHYWGPRYQVAPIEAAVEGEWAHGVAQWQGEAKTLSGPIHILAHRLSDGSWQALLPGGDGLYRQWVEAVPESLVPAGEKGRLRAQAGEAEALRSPQAMPAVPPAATAMPPGQEELGEAGEPIESAPGLMQPTATPTAMPLTSEGPLRLLAEASPVPMHPETASSVTWAVEGDRSVVYAITNEGTRTKVTDEPFDRMLLPQFSIFITLSPDGRMITYVTADDEMLSNARLWIVNIDGTNRRLLAAFTDDLWIAPLVWSPESVHLVFARSVRSSLKSGIELWLIGVSTGEQTRIANTPGLTPQLFYGAHPSVMHWTEHGIEYTDYVSLPGFKFIYTIAPDTGAVSRRTAELTTIESYSVIIQATLPCGVSQFSQNDPDWRGIVMQTCGLTIGQAGCALTSVAMDFRYFGVNTSPPILNSCLGTSTCPIYWGTAASNCSEDKVSYLGSPGFSWNTVESNLSAGRPVIVELNGGDGHFVVVISGSGSNGSGYTINDPWDGQVKSLTAYTNNGWTPTGLRIYDGTPWCQGGGTCPTSSGVILYKHANYDCGGEGEGSGYVLRSSTGWQNVPGTFSDQASSLRVPSDWSVRLYEHSDRNGASVCRNGEDNDFAGDYFDGGSVPLNDHVSSFEVFDNTHCRPGSQYPVTLYEHPDYNGSWCALIGEGWANVCQGFNDVASSIRLQSGWSARVYQDTDRGGSSRCFTGDDSNFSDNTFENGSPLDNQVSSFEALNNTSCTPPCSPPSAPSLSSPSNGAKLYPEDDLVFNWHGNASEYRVHWWGGPGGDHYSDWMGGTSWNVGQQWESPNRYYWSVRGRNGSGCEGDWSSTWEFMIGPRASSNLNASAASSSQINLSWQDNSSSESDYHVERSPNGSSWQQIATVSGTSYQDNGLNASTTYYYRVRAHRHNDDTYSKYSNTANATTPSCPPPAAPTLVSPANGAVLPHDADITLDWNSSGGATGYYAHLWGGPTIDINSGWTGGTNWHIGQLWPGTYSWQVNARNQCGESGWSSTRTFTVENPSIGPLGYDDHTVDDDNTGQSNGDGDGVVECGETIELYVTLRNQGSGTATGVNATISTGDPYITWLYNTNSTYPDISVGGTGINSNDFDFAVAPSTPDGHVIQFDLNINASNGGPWGDSFSVPVACPQPDLHPYTPSGYPYPVVPSSVQGTHTVNTLYASQPTYFDWHFINGGGGVAPGTFYVELWVDSTRYVRYPQPDFAPGQDGGLDDWAETITTPGWHTVRLITDPDNTVAESDETNNIWERQFYWTPPAPYSDNMENGVDDWTATGLWHQVDGNSPYPASHSGTRSWWYGQDSTGNYDTSSANSGDLTSPSIYIPGSGYYLRFWYRYETETQSQSWDQRWVQISMDGGPFSNILQLYDDPMNRWLQSPAISLSGYASHTIRVRFHFDTLDGGFNAYRGWYVDDFSISSTPPPSCADSHESNNTPAQATSIAYGQSRNADICPGGDYDYYRFTGAADDKVVVDIDAKSNGSLLDSYAFLLDSDGTTVLAENDDEIQVEVPDSHFGYQLPHDGTYYIKVRAWDHPSAGGTGYFYTIRLLRDNTNPSSAVITSPGNDAWLDPGQETISVSAADNQSGISHVAFLWHDADWANSDWVWLGEDRDGRDGWGWDFDTSGLAEQRGGAFYIWAFDWAGNWTGAGAWDLGIDRTLPTAGADVSLMYGDAPFLDFYVWWSGSDNLSGVASYDVQYRDGAGGAWTHLLSGTTGTYYHFVGQNGHTYYFRARARDNAGNLSTYASGNGDAQHTVQVCATAADAREPDNSYIAATAVITDGTWYPHNFHAAGDQDWSKFTAGAGITYTLVTTNSGGHADTVLYLYESDGITLITSNDDDPVNWPASRLDWGARRDGTYYVKVEHWDPYAYGCTTAYELSIAETGIFEVANKVFLPIILK